MRRQLFGVLLLAAAVVATGGNLMAVDCSNDACCVNAATCVVTDRETLEALSIDEMVSCDITLSTWVSGGGATGLAPANWPTNLCGLSFSGVAATAAQAYNSLDHKWLQSTTVPKVSDFATPVNTVFVFPAVDHGPFPEEGIESTVWGRTDSSSVAGFPAGWTLATLTTIWKKGWEEPVACDTTADNADDFTGQYSFPGDGFRYIAVHSNYSISIFDDPAHTTWTATADDHGGVAGWQSFDDEIDAVGTSVCDDDTVIADAGPDQDGIVGDELCFNASGSSGGIVSYGWDLDGDSEIDVSGIEACFTCTEETEGDITLFVSDNCCVDSDTAHFTCTLCDPDPRTQGYWHRQ